MARSYNSTLAEYESIPGWSFETGEDGDHVEIHQNGSTVALMLADILAIQDRFTNTSPEERAETARGVAFRVTGTRAFDRNASPKPVVEIGDESTEENTVRVTTTALTRLADECPYPDAATPSPAPDAPENTSNRGNQRVRNPRPKERGAV